MITPKQRAYLRGIAAVSEPVTQIGKNGITANVIKTLSDALEAHELVKVTVLETCPTTAKETMDLLCGPLRADPVQVIGRKISLYRRQPDASKRKIELPADKRGAKALKP